MAFGLLLRESGGKPQSGTNREENQQDATIRCLLLTSISTCFGHHYAHLQENKDPVTAFGVLFCSKREKVDIGRDVFFVGQCVVNLGLLHTAPQKRRHG